MEFQSTKISDEKVVSTGTIERLPGMSARNRPICTSVADHTW